MINKAICGVISTCLAVLAFSANAATVTQGYLTSNDDGSTNIITDSLNNVEYLRLDVLADLTYSQTQAVLGTQEGGGWSIASSTDALAFIDAAFGGAGISCTHEGSDVTNPVCGQLTGWYDGKLGDDFYDSNSLSPRDNFFFIDNGGEADYTTIDSHGNVALDDFSLVDSDTYSGSAPNTISWLVVRPTVVPVPAAIWLFASGLLGLIGFARRNKA